MVPQSLYDFSRHLVASSVLGESEEAEARFAHQMMWQTFQCKVMQFELLKSEYYRQSAIVMLALVMACLSVGSLEGK